MSSKTAPVSFTSKYQELCHVLEQHRGERMLILLDGYPDPDNIGAALAHRFLCQQYGIECHTIHFQEISHQENKALVKRLGINLLSYKEDMDLTIYQGYALLDTQRTKLPIIEKLGTIPLITFVDHHKTLGEVKAEFVDIREDVGSTSAIYTEYLKENVALNPLKSGNAEHIKLATALMYGIRADTQDLIYATPLDYEACSFLCDIADTDLLKVIATQSMAPQTMDIIQRALERKKVIDNFIISDVGFVDEDFRDSIPQAADFLLCRDGTDTVLVYGIVNEEVVDGSFRTSSNLIDPDKFLKRTFGADEEGKYYGGGNTKDKGGFQIPLGFFAHYNNKDTLYKVVKEIIEERFYERIGRKGEQKEENAG
jgi:nanoRNase/pAp phosphatase (c-di-AMP/oligoRNAs hydrolase)